MEFKELLLRKEDIISQVSAIIFGKEQMTMKDLQDLDKLRKQVQEIEFKINTCPFFHPETLYSRWSQ